jgi:hypothetical protein
MKSLVVVAVLILSVCTVACNHSSPTKPGSDATPKQSETPREPQPVFTPHIATLAEQKMCDEQALKRFHEYTEKNEKFATYTSHYDPSVNVCYVRVNRVTADKFPMDNSNVFDAFEGRMYASYMWMNPQGKKYWEVSPSDCEINIPGKDKIVCKSSDEFSELTEKYFGVAQ